MSLIESDSGTSAWLTKVIFWGRLRCSPKYEAQSYTACLRDPASPRTCLFR